MSGSGALTCGVIPGHLGKSQGPAALAVFLGHHVDVCSFRGWQSITFLVAAFRASGYLLSYAEAMWIHSHCVWGNL